MKIIENFGSTIKTEIQKFLKSSEIVSQENKKIVTIEEKGDNAKLKELNINLDSNGKFWLLKAENLKDKALAFEIKGKKVEAILFHLDENNLLNIILIEMKSFDCKKEEIEEKVINSIIWLSYLLLLNDNKDNQDVKIYIVIAKREAKKEKNRNCEYKEFFGNSLKILNDYKIWISVKEFLSKEENQNINLSEIYKRD